MTFSTYDFVSFFFFVSNVVVVVVSSPIDPQLPKLLEDSDRHEFEFIDNEFSSVFSSSSETGPNF
ncbi:hypothetical protein HanRHA438_Chr10g0432981 [Helianthus annuus]|nr:hypothetical protein HanRHA438_Chr10g0432981 [Helianthus annuus]